jgi:hypothetical protein
MTVKVAQPKIKLTAALIEGFAGTFLSPLYDDAKPTPQFHREAWAMYGSDEPFCAVAAPRGHAKSTALTHDYTLATALFRVEDYMILVSSNEEMAIEHLGDITREVTSLVLPCASASDATRRESPTSRDNLARRQFAGATDEGWELEDSLLQGTQRV